MRMLFSLVGLLLALLVVVWLVRTELRPLASPPAVAGSASARSGEAGGLVTPQQYKQQLDRAMSASHPTVQESP
jgi:hypothetical protein